MATDKKITELPAASGLGATDVSVLVSNGVDYQFSISQLLQYFTDHLTLGALLTFDTTLPQNTSGKNGDIFLKTNTGQFAQKLAGTWTVMYTLPGANAGDGTLLYGAGEPGSSIGKNSDSYIDTLTGIFYLKSAGNWSQVFSMQTGPQGPKGAKGDDGPTGLNGKSILNGTTNPSNATTGADGDFYINTNTLTLFGPKTAGIWGAGQTLVGADGAQGETGPAGPTGAAGATGAAGIAGATGPAGPAGLTGSQGPAGPTGATGANGTAGANGSAGPAGATGPPGAPGQGIPTGGTTGQVLSKNSGTNYDTQWVNPPAGTSSISYNFYQSIL